MNTIPRWRAWVLLVACAGAVTPLLAYKEVPPPENVVLSKPRSPAESLAAIKVAAGFEVELVAAEPLGVERERVSCIDGYYH